MNILIVVDKYGTAIDRLAQSVKKHNTHFNIKVLSLHPKRPDAFEIAEIHKALQWCDLLDVHYWKSGEKIKELYPDLFNSKKKILCHFNPYDLDKQPWHNIYDLVIVGNQEQHIKMPYARLIPYAIDLDQFTFNEDYKDNKIVQMVVGRIEGKKGVLEVAKACKELGYDFELIGRISKPDYFQEVIKTTGFFFEDVTDRELVERYHRATIHVCNSVDGFETGTLPILEAMACGVPVLTRNIGHVPDLFNGKNMVVRQGKEDDIEDLKKELKDLMENRERRLKIRSYAFETVKNRNEKKMARQFSQVYYKLLGNNLPLVSVIIPTKDRMDTLFEVVAGVINQDYKNKEIVIVDSSSYDNADKYKIGNAFANLIKQTYNIPVKYLFCDSKGYNLAEARNIGVVESEGEILVFNDDRIQMQPDAIHYFVGNSKQHCWLWGVKDDYEKGFVENFSCIKREDLIKGGIFLERMNVYGGMSQELRERFTKQGYVFEMIRESKAKSIRRSNNRPEKRKQMIEAKLLLYKLYG